MQKTRTWFPVPAGGVFRLSGGIALAVWLLTLTSTAAAREPVADNQSAPDSIQENVLPPADSVDSTDPLNWDPLGMMSRMDERMQQLLNMRPGGLQYDGMMTELEGIADVELVDQGDHFEVTVDLSQLDESSLEIKAQSQSLTISGKREMSMTDRDSSGQVTGSYYNSSSFQQTVGLPEPVRPDDMTSRVEEKKLIISLPKQS